MFRCFVRVATPIRATRYRRPKAGGEPTVKTSSMPQFWDLASFLTNTALFHGFDHPLIAMVSELSRVTQHSESFWWSMRRLERWPKFIHD
jgi:hypothetical protein